ncbi:MAG: trehalose-phosphatase [Chloroflexi bacterium HGW-Chloroflexi-4]|jgi:trehalose 6-phosphate phosphatase|nr:MAG: trehalose-phosphatase [Chloroflexi bacterium HGW-Chloroflexi-4]
MKREIYSLTKIAVETPRLRLFLDYDGTLAEFALTPDTVLPDPELIFIFQQLINSPGVLPAIISGRRLSHIQELLPVKGLLLAGTYGVEMQLPNGELRNALTYEKIRPIINQILPHWQKLIQNLTGFYLEDKGWSLALHGKNASPSDLHLVMTKAQSSAQKMLPESNFHLSVSERFLEVSPTLANKAVAVKWILEEMTPEQTLSIYIGDDEKDEDGFKPVIASGGYAVRVSEKQTSSLAQFHMTDPFEVRQWINNLIHARKMENERILH